MARQRLAAHQKKARRQEASLALIDESGLLMAPLVRRTWAPRGQTPDLDQNSDLVRALLCIFVGTSLCLLCKRVISFLPRSFRITVLPPVCVIHKANRTIEAAVSPPESFLLIGSLRI